jgi:hypothetical protein
MNKRFEKLTNGETNRQPNEQRTNKRIKEQRTVFKQTNGLPNKQTNGQTNILLFKPREIEDLISWPLSHSNINSTQQNIALPN